MINSSILLSYLYYSYQLSSFFFKKKKNCWILKFLIKRLGTHNEL